MNKIICWWSGGVTSAVACMIAIEMYGAENCRVIFMDTHNEHDDTYRFMKDCAIWYGLPIETISEIGKDYESIQDVWRRHSSLNTAKGAVCSSRLKARLRQRWQNVNTYRHQVFGFEFERSEFNRAKAMLLDHEVTKPIFPLLMMGYDKKKCFEILTAAGIEIPVMYKLGFANNNCFKTGCVQAGVGYWQKMKREFPDKFETMAAMEHELTDKCGYPVTILKDQSNFAKAKKKLVDYSDLVFLKKHPRFENRCIDDMKPQELEPLVDCNGFCGLNDLAGL